MMSSDDIHPSSPLGFGPSLPELAELANHVMAIKWCVTGTLRNYGDEYCDPRSSSSCAVRRPLA